MKVGLEIHQRLNTSKLFCNCSSEGKNQILGTIKRKLHAVKSETGKIDKASLTEQMQDKTYEYVIFDNCCLVELDEEPPHDINGNALLVALAVSNKMDMKILDQINIMRKTVIDGSNTSGFQRTAIVSMNGKINTSKGAVGITTLSIEEESASILGDKGESKFGLDRLGIPLLEITTEPDIVDGEHARETAEKIGMLLRMTGKALRGIGTIRQDVNVSIEGGARVEIKGVQELDDIPVLIEKECERQRKLIEIINKLPNKKNGIILNDVTHLLKEGKGWIPKELSKGSVGVALTLPGLKGILGIELYENRRYGTELSDRGKVYGFGGLIHGDEQLDKYGLNESEIRKELKLKENDNFVILIGKNDEKMNFAFNEIFNRAYLKVVPGETRKAIVNGGSQFMRQISTGARMYPETDVPPIRVTKELIKESKKYEPRDPEEVLIELEKETNKDLAPQLLKSKHLMDYRTAISEGVEPVVAAVTFVNTLKNVSRDKINIDNIEGEEIVEILVKYSQGKITKKGIEEIIRIKCQNEKMNVEEIIKKNKLEKLNKKEIEKIIKEEEFDVKKIMMKYANNVEASEVMELIKKVKSK